MSRHRQGRIEMQWCRCFDSRNVGPARAGHCTAVIDMIRDALSAALHGAISVVRLAPEEIDG
jgi:hypothetical protein